jgi:cytoskeletal protein CcmA (bactofilin family)
MMLVSFATPAVAADFRGDDTIIIASGDIINDDLYLIGNRIVINGTIIGDALCIGNHITVSGRIEGNVTAIGATIEIEGEVTRSLRVAGSDVTVSGEVGRDVVVAGDKIDLTDQAAIGNDLVFAGRSINVDSLIEEGILGASTKTVLSSIIGDDVEVVVDRLTISSTAIIQGDLVYTSENEAVIQSGARIIGSTTHNLATHYDFPDIGLWVGFIAFFMTLVTGIVIILVAPKRAQAVAESIKVNTLPALGWGALALFVTPIALVLVFITIIGIPVSVMGLIVYVIAIFLSQIAVGLFIGYWILGYLRSVDSRGILIGAFVIGFTLLTLVKLIPYIGWALWLATTVFGIGAMLLSQRTLRSQQVEKVETTIN